MANEERIDSIIDIPSVEREVNVLKEHLTTLQGSIQKLNSLSVKLNGLEKGKDIAAGVREVTVAMDAYTTSSKETINQTKKLTDAQQKLAAAQTEEGKRLAEIRLQTAEANKANKLAAAEALGLVDAYKKLEQQYNLAAKAAKNAVVQFGLESKEAKEAAAEALKLDAALKQADAAVGRFNKNVGNYNGVNSGINGDVPFTTNLAQLEEERESLKKTGTVVNTIELIEAEAAASATAWGAANKGVAEELNVVGKETQKIALTEEELKAQRAAAAIANERSLTQQIVYVKELKAELSLLSTTQLKTPYGKQLVADLGTAQVELKKMKTEAGLAATSTGNLFQKAFSGIRQLAYILPGIGIAGLLGLIFTPLFDGLTKLVDKLFESTDKLKKVKEVVEEAKTAFTSASATVSKLREDIQLAKEGFLDKDKVVKEYNETIGKTTGKVNSLDEAEQALVKNADAYIDMMFKKEVATLSYKKAAEKALEAELNRIKKEQEFNTISTRAGTFGTGDVTAPGFVPGQDPLKGFKARAKAAADEKQKEIQKAKDQQKEFQDIGNDYEKQAAEIAKKFHFNFFEDKAQGKGGKKDAKKDSDEFVKDQIDGLKAISKSDEFYYTDRLQKREEAFELEKVLIAKQLKDKTLTQNDYNKAIEKAEREREIDVMAIRASFHKQQRDQAKDAEEDILRLKKESEERQLAAAQSEFDKRAAGISGNQQKEIEVLNARYKNEYDAAKGNKEKQKQIEEQYQKERADIDFKYAKQILEQEIKLAEAILDIREASGENVDAQRQKLNALKLQYSDLITKHEIDNNKKVEKSEDDKYDKIISNLERVRQISDEVFGIIGGAIDASVTAQKNKLQEQSDMIDKRTEHEIEAINASTKAEQQKADEIAVIQARAQAQKNNIEVKQRQLDQRKAEFDKAKTISDIILTTAIAVVKGLKDGGLPLALLYGALGAAELAIAVATPIPKYRHGTKDHKGGLAIVGDGGISERVKLPGGQEFDTPDTATLMNLPRGTVVLPDASKVQADVLKSSFKGLRSVPVGAGRSDQFDLLTNQIKSLQQTIQNKPTAIIRNTHNGVQLGLKSQQGYQEWVTKNMQS